MLISVLFKIDVNTAILKPYFLVVTSLFMYLFSVHFFKFVSDSVTRVISAVMDELCYIEELEHVFLDEINPLPYK